MNASSAPAPVVRPEGLPTDRSADPLVSVSDLRVSLQVRGESKEVIRGVDLEIGRGEVLGLAGESGSGKSITALGLLRLLPAGATTQGGVHFDGIDVNALDSKAVRRYRATQARMIFQDPRASLNPMLSIGRQLRTSLSTVEKLPRKEADRRALEGLERVGIPEPQKRLKQYPYELSGGMLQRVMIAFALIGRPQLLVCDEPTTALDVTTEAQIMDLLGELNRDLGMAMLLTSHDLTVLADACDRLAVMYAGRIVEVGDVHEVLTDPKHPYTKALVGSTPDPERPREPLPVLGGSPPPAGDIGPGCAFAPRCSSATDRCRTRPELMVLQSGPTPRSAACWLNEEESHV